MIYTDQPLAPARAADRFTMSELAAPSVAIERASADGC